MRKIALTVIILLVGISAVHLSSKDWTDWNDTPRFDQAADALMPTAALSGHTGNEFMQFRAGGHILGFSAESVLMASGTHALKVEFVGAGETQPISVGEAAHANSEIGIPATAKGVPELNEVRYSDLWPGITLKYEGRSGSVVKSTYEVAPGADPNSIRLQTNVPVEIDANGLLHYKFETGEMVESKPVAWQEIKGRRVNIGVDYRVVGEREIGFILADYDRAYPVIIDPVLIWNTFLGNGEADYILGKSVSLDGNGDILIAGVCNGSWGSPIRPYAGGYYDIYVSKFNASGAVVWNTFLGGPGSETLWGIGLTVDGEGNAFVYGISDRTWGNPVRPFDAQRDVFVAKLNGNGALQWNTFLGGFSEDTGLGIDFDGSGNLFVAGYSAASWGSPVRAFTGTTGAYDAFVAKLNSSGVLQWNTFLGGSSYDHGTSVAVDGAGNLFVTGSSDQTWGTPIRSFGGGVSDAFVAQLGSDGALQWTTFLGGTGHDSANDLVLDSTGNAFVVGTSYDSWGSPIYPASETSDAFVAKLVPGGALQWHTFIGGTEFYHGTSIALDGSGSIFIAGTGEEAFAAKLDSGGVLTWKTLIGDWTGLWGVDIAVDSSGNAFVAGTSSQNWGSPLAPYRQYYDAYLVKLGPGGSLLWHTFVGGQGGHDRIEGSVADGLGNVYVTGKSTKSWGNPIRPFTGGDNDAFVAKLDSDGAVQWNTFLGGAGEDDGGAITVDAQGNIFVAGTSQAAWGNPVQAFGGPSDVFAAKLSSSGALIWNTFQGETSLASCRAIDIDGSGGVYVAGTISEPDDEDRGAQRYDAFAAKWDASGTRLWRTQVGSYAGDDSGYGIAVDNSGNAILTGNSESDWGSPIRPFPSWGCFFAAKLNANGILQWNTFLGGSNPSAAGNVIVDGSGNAYVTGESRSTWGSPIRPYGGGVADAFLAKLSPGGSLAWNTFLGAASASGLDLAFDAAGNLITAGSLSLDIFVAKWTAAGAYLWEMSLGGLGIDFVSGVAVDPLDNIFITGNSEASWGSPILPFRGQNRGFVARLSDLPSLSLTSPNGGEAYVGGATQPITWTSGGSIANVKLEYSADSGAAWTTIVSSTPNTGTFPWMVPGVSSAYCLVRVSAAGTGTPADTSDAAFSITTTTPVIGLSKTSLNFGTEQNGTPTPAETVIVTNLGVGTLNWTAVASDNWISVTPGSGTGAGMLTIGISRTDMSPGTYLGTVTVSDPAATNSPRTIQVVLIVASAGTDAVPFGEFDTPLDNANVSSSIAVTGWALDDVGVETVKIYRGTDLSDRIFIGDAVFVQGARPDVEISYPAYPRSDRAGWGYMLLTNFLPNGGNGTFPLLAYATDSNGHEVLIGSKTINVDNANAVLPFGAIDTPTQGGTAFGSSYMNFGWALTPQPKSIPTDGSTITVWVDGLPLAHPVYNNYRGDIATLFPGYVNSNGAVGYYNLDTTGYTDGVHTIAWSVVDSAGAVDGIGSRFFTIQNAAGGSSLEGLQTAARPMDEILLIPDDVRTPVYLKRGFDRNANSEIAYPESDGTIRIAMPQVSRIAVYLNEVDENESSVMDRLRERQRRSAGKTGSGAALLNECYELVGSELRPLPIGASFDPETAVLYWQPGPGFVGEFTFVFVKNGSAGAGKKIVKITVGPQSASIR